MRPLPELVLLLCFVVLRSTVPALGAELFIYPDQGQSPEQQARDRQECHVWAVQQTNFDPTQPPTAQPTTPATATGSLFGRRPRAGQARQEQTQTAHAEQEEAAFAQRHASYKRAMSACLVGRGYSVK
jgi:hypothetical protein